MAFVLTIIDTSCGVTQGIDYILLLLGRNNVDSGLTKRIAVIEIM